MTLTLAFAEDPPSRWLYPNEEDYLNHFPKFIRRLEALHSIEARRL